MASDLAMQLAAQAWCQPQTSGKEMDADLCSVFAQILDEWIETASQESGNSAFYCELLDQCAQILGKDAFTSDDGSVQQVPVRLKIPELIQKLVRGACGE